MVYKSFGEKSSGGSVENEFILNQELDEELHKLIIRKFEKRKVYSSFKDNIWGSGLEDVQSISKFDKIFRFLCAIIVYNKYVWVVPLKDEKGITITTITQAFHEILEESGRNPDKIWVDKGIEFYNRSICNVYKIMIEM